MYELGSNGVALTCNTTYSDGATSPEEGDLSLAHFNELARAGATDNSWPNSCYTVITSFGSIQRSSTYLQRGWLSQPGMFNSREYRFRFALVGTRCIVPT